jgi:hypothetical protein
MPVLIRTGPRVTRPFVCSHAFAAAMSTQADAVGGHGFVAGSYVGVGDGAGLDAGAAVGLDGAGFSGDALGGAEPVAATGTASAPVELPAFATMIALVARAALATMTAASASLAFPRRNRISSR